MKDTFGTSLILTETYIKIFNFKKTKSGIEILSLDKFIIKEEGALLKKDIKRVFKKRSGRANTILGLSSSEVEVHYLSLPVLSPKDKEDAINFYIAKNKPFGEERDNLYYFFLDIEGPKIKGEELILFISPSKIINKKLEFFNRLKIKIDKVMPSSLGLLSLKDFTSSPSDSINLWIYIGDDDSFFVLETNRLPLFCKSIPVSFKILNKEISSSLGISEEEADNFQKEKGLEYWQKEKKYAEILPREDRKIKITQKLVSSLEGMVINIQKDINQFSKQYSLASNFERIFLSGDMAQVKKIDDFLSSLMDVPVEKIDIFNYYRTEEKIKETYQLGYSFTLCGGLCRSDNQNTFVLLKKTTSFTKVLTFGFFSLLLIVLISVFARGMYKVSVLKKEALSLEKKISAYQDILASSQEEVITQGEREASLLEEKKKLDANLKYLNNFFNNRKLISEILGKILSNLSSDTNIQRVSYEEGILYWEGVCFNTKDIFLLLKFIKENISKNVELSYFEKDKKNNIYTFKLYFPIR